MEIFDSIKKNLIFLYNKKYLKLNGIFTLDTFLFDSII